MELNNNQLRKQIDKMRLLERVGYGIYHPEVKRFHESTARIKVVCAPRRTTKSYSAAHDVLDLLLLENARVWVVGPDYSLAEKEFRYIHKALVIDGFKLGLPPPIHCSISPKAGKLLIEWPWGAILEGKSADRPSSLLGESVDAVIYAEAAQLHRKIREQYVQPTLSTTKGVELVPTTPSSGAEWVYELWLAGKEGKFPDYIETFEWNHTANPKYPVSELEQAKKFYGEDHPVFREQYLGEWVFYQGIVYNDFKEDLHLIDPFDIPSSWPRIRGIDFGSRDPFVCLWAAVGPEGELYFYREYYSKDNKPMKEHTEMIRELSRDELITMTVCDPSSAQGRTDLAYYGIPSVTANNDRLAGRLRVKDYMLPSMDGSPPVVKDKNIEKKLRDGRLRWPKMYFFRDMFETRREIKFYRWRERKDYSSTTEKTEGDDHAMDVLRYITMTRPSPSKIYNKVQTGTFAFEMAGIQTKRSALNYIR